MTGGLWGLLGLPSHCSPVLLGPARGAGREWGRVQEQQRGHSHGPVQGLLMTLGATQLKGSFPSSWRQLPEREAPQHSC